MTKQIKNVKSYVLIFIIIIIITVVGLEIYSQSLKQDLTDQSCKTLNEITEQQKFNFMLEIKSEISIIKASASLLSYFDYNFEGHEDHIDHNNESMIQAMNDIVMDTKFEFLIVANTKGEGLVQDGRQVDVSQRLHFQKALKGETVLPMPIDSLLQDETVIPLTTPIIKNNEVIGVLIGSYRADEFNNLLLSAYDGKGYTFVVNSSGEIIAKTKNDYTITQSNNLFESWEEFHAEFYEYDNFDTILTNIKEGKEGHTSYRIEGKNRLAHYSPIGINDWYVFVTIPEEVIAENAIRIINHAGYLALAIIISFFLFIVYILFMQQKASKQERTHTAQMERMAYVDELTEERSFNKFKEDAQRILEENADESHVLVKLDVENFKLINKTFGFSMGDRILQTISLAIKTLLENDNEIFSRLSVDEFIILHNYQGREKLDDIKNAFIDKFYELMGDDFEYIIKFKLGQYVVEREEAQRADINELFEKVNFAHRKAKQSIAVDTVFYDEELTRAALYQKELENKMEKALADEEFLIYLQPKYLIKDESIGGVEALVRWRTLDGQLIYPNDFIPVFEQNGFIIQLDMYMLKKACELIKGWMDDNIKPIIISVNFSRLHLNNKFFVSDVCKIVDAFGIERKWIEIELTETAIYDNIEVLEEILMQLHKAGFTMSMDDFGSGYSSLGLLKDLPVDVIKIDRSFFVKQKNELRSKAVVGSVMSMAGKLGIHTVAEGVEDRAHVDLLRELSCDMVQGYYFAKPMSAEEFTKMIQEKKHTS